MSLTLEDILRENTSSEDESTTGIIKTMLATPISTGQTNNIMARSYGSIHRGIGENSEYDGVLGRIVTLLRESFNRSGRRSYYQTGVFRHNSNSESKEVINEIDKRGSNCNFKWVIRHGNHYHVIHDCMFSNGQCRCFGIKLYSKSGRNKILAKDFTDAHWRHILEYHLQDGREESIYEIDQTDQSGLLDRFKNLRSKNNIPGAINEEGRSMEACECESQIFRERLTGQTDQTTDDELSGIDGSEPRRPRKRGRRSAQNEEAKKIDDYFLKICASPITDGDRTKYWVNSEYEYINDLHKVIKNVKNTIRLKFSHMTLNDYINFYQQKIDNNITPLFAAISHETFNDYYFTEKQSQNKVMQLLIFQLAPGSLDSDFYIENDNWMATVFLWLKDFLLFLDKRSGKNNCYYFLSSSCSGKTFFMDMIKDYFLNTGNMSNWNRYSQFPLQMCADKRVIFWNEPNCEPSAFEDLKKVLGGEFFSANIKNKDHCEIKRTPIIITGNPPYIFPKEEAFAVRIKNLTWNTAPFLKDNGSMKLHPYTLNFLIKLTENYYNKTLSEMKYNEIP